MMKKILNQSILLYFCYTSIKAGFSILFWKLGYDFHVTNAPLWVILTLLNILLEASLCITSIKHQATSSKTAKTVVWFLPLVASATAFSIFTNDTPIFIFAAFVNIIFCAIIYFSFMFISNKRISILKGILFALSGALFALSFFISLFVFFITSSNGITIVEEVDSPSKLYTAIVIDSDQGALGGDTYVQVRYNISKIDLGYGYFVKTKGVYSGPYGAYRSIKIEWKEESLFINNYPIVLEE